MLKRIDDVDGKDLGKPFYRVQVIVRRVDAEDPQGNVTKEKVLNEGVMDMSLANANKALYSVGIDPIVES
ncbi:hypothetical protein LCGC14_0659160 [marine sediment metagenome]|uniref:Uncharacterized protein n=1 Tax=marine sediment metagenome TaxID=412755 RepID=A0A0F9QU42_9ZZZZ